MVTFRHPLEYIKETPRRRIAVTSSLNEISTDQLGKRVEVRGERRYSARPHPAAGQIFKDDVIGFSSISDFFFVPKKLLNDEV